MQPLQIIRPNKEGLLAQTEVEARALALKQKIRWFVQTKQQAATQNVVDWQWMHIPHEK